jgi:hypothetical protein
VSRAQQLVSFPPSIEEYDMHRLIVSILAAAAATAAPAVAQVSSIGHFTGQVQESFEGPQVLFTACIAGGVFGGAATLCTPTGNNCHTTTGWSFVCTIFPQTGSYFYASTDGPTEIVFTNDVHRFGGYFGSNSTGGDATFEFYDANNALISTEIALFPNDCAWRWFGWQSCSAGIRRIVVTGINTSGQGYVDMDGLEADFAVPSSCNTNPTAYCTSGTTTSGCNASISAAANPSANFSTPCFVNVNNVEGQKTGIVFYGLEALPQPWCPSGTTSFLCVKPPTARTFAANSGGTVGQCDGSFLLDWNAFHAALPGSLGTPFSPGDKVYLQAWFRDPASCRGTSLSDGLEVTMQ